MVEDRDLRDILNSGNNGRCCDSASRLSCCNVASSQPGPASAFLNTGFPSSYGPSHFKLELAVKPALPKIISAIYRMELYDLLRLPPYTSAHTSGASQQCTHWHWAFRGRSPKGILQHISFRVKWVMSVVGLSFSCFQFMFPATDPSPPDHAALM